MTKMQSMFGEAKSFNADLSKWDVSKVTNMAKMFKGASSFAQTLCGAWFASTANKEDMFEDSSGRVCRKCYRHIDPPDEDDSLHGLINALILTQCSTLIMKLNIYIYMYVFHVNAT